MDQTEFNNLTGMVIRSSQSDRFSYLSTASAETLEGILGWPLDPSDWDDQYEELGKLEGDWNSYNGDPDTLEAPDEVIGVTRLYRWSPVEPYLHIDPATEIHAIKLVRNGVTYKTFDPLEYSLQMQNGMQPFGRYVRIDENFLNWFNIWDYPAIIYERRGEVEYVQVAVDAEWAFEELPTPLLKLQADLIAYELDIKRDVKSESVLGHSYSRNTRQEPVTVHAATIAKYAGPNGTSTSKVVLE